MATISTGISILDSMSPVLRNITNALNLTISAMQDVHGSVGEAFDTRQIDAARSSIQQAEAALNGLNPPIENAARSQDGLNESLNEGTEGAKNLLGKVVAVVGAYMGFRAVKGFLSESRDAANDLIRANQRLQSIMSNVNGMTQDGIDLVRTQAQELEKVTSVGVEVGTFGLSQLSEYVYDPNNLKALSESMYNLATETYGVGVSQDQIKQTADLMGKAMMGQIDALSRNGFKLSSILSEAEIKMFKYGTEAERAALLVQVLDENQKNLARDMAQTDEGQILQAQNAWAGLQQTIGYGVNNAISGFMILVMNNLPTIQTMFENVFFVLFNLFERLIGFVSDTVDFFTNNWSVIEPILWGVVGALGGLYAVLKLVAIGQAIVNAVMSANPFILIATLIIGLILYLVRLWQTNDKFAAAMMRAWNTVLNFFDQVPIFFTRVGNGITNVFQSMKVKSLQIMEDLINGVIDDTNKLIKLLNKIPGVNIEAIGNVSFAASAAAEAEAIRQAGEENLAKMQENAATRAAEREKKVQDMLDSRAAKRAEEEANKKDMFKAPDSVGKTLGNGAWDTGPNINKVGEVGKIKDKVDISSEDLKTMRELAEMKNIQNFVTLTPTVSVQTGDIQNGYDVDTIVARITTSLEEQIASSAKGVYA